MSKAPDITIKPQAINQNSKDTPKISVVIPIYGNIGNIQTLIDALNQQTIKPHEIIIVDSNPTTTTIPKATNIKYIKNPTDIALSWDYNLGLSNSTGDFQLNMQQDCMPADTSAIERLYNHINKPGRVAAVALVTLPNTIFEQYNFWGKLLMARWVGKFKQGISGKFDLIRKDVFSKINGYDTKTFSFAGEDMDLYLRLSKHGEVYVAPDVEVVHYHQQANKTNFNYVIKKNYILAESFGALFRRWGFKLKTIPYAGHWSHHIAKFLYPCFLLIPFAPKTTIIIILLLTQLISFDAWKTTTTIKQQLILALLNPILLLTGLVGTTTGLLTGKQQYSQNK